MSEQIRSAHEARQIRRFGISGSPAHRPREEDRLAVEEPLEIRLVYGPEAARIEQAVSITMRSPGNDLDLALGFLFGEGILENKRQLVDASHADEFCSSGASKNTVRVQLQESFEPDLERLRRHFYTSSSCGVCGKASLAAITALKPPPLCWSEPLSPSLVNELPDQLRKAQSTFSHTGGLHAAGLFDIRGNLQTLREDVGRHNAVDKVIGKAFSLGALPLADHLMLLSGRASFELVQKALMAGIPILAAVGAPSTLAVDLAREHDLTLLGFVREERFNVYSGEHRLTSELVTSKHVAGKHASTSSNHEDSY